MKFFVKIFLPLLVAALLLSACLPLAAPTTAEPPPPAAASGMKLPQDELTVVFFDVGQADCALISTGGQNMLIDAGNLGQDELVLGYLAEYGIDKLDYLVATHPHADHIGAMAAVVNNMKEIGTVLMPEAIANTNVFESLLGALEQRDFAITVPQAGESFALGEAVIQVLAPLGSDYDSLNNYSLVLRVSFGQTALLFTGDAESLSEQQQLDYWDDLRADLLKVGHHGSSTSSGAAYLAAVSPRYAVISCGLGNSYGHPHQETLAALGAGDIAVYRTDHLGTLVFSSDGQTIFTPADAAPADATPADAASPGHYIGNKNSGVFHLPSCATLPAEHNRVALQSRDEALAEGFRPCGSCQP